MYIYIYIYVYIDIYVYAYFTVYPQPSSLNLLPSTLYPVPSFIHSHSHPFTLTYSLTHSLSLSGGLTKTPQNYVNDPWGDPKLLNRSNPHPGKKPVGFFSVFPGAEGMDRPPQIILILNPKECPPPQTLHQVA